MIDFIKKVITLRLQYCHPTSLNSRIFRFQTLDFSEYLINSSYRLMTYEVLLELFSKEWLFTSTRIITQKQFEKKMLKGTKKCKACGTCKVKNETHPYCTITTKKELNQWIDSMVDKGQTLFDNIKEEN